MHTSEGHNEMCLSDTCFICENVLSCNPGDKQISFGAWSLEFVSPCNYPMTIHYWLIHKKDGLRES